MFEVLSKKFSSETTIDSNGFPLYRRRNDGRTIIRNNIEYDNRHVVPYNRYLLTKFQCHCNSEWCNRSNSIKYLFKYINKGPNRGKVLLTENDHLQNGDKDTTTKNTDEIKQYFDCRYLSEYEAAWRIYNFEIQYKEPSVERMIYHLENEHVIYFPDGGNLQTVFNKPGIEKRMFTK